jgi:hypothetical protein
MQDLQQHHRQRGERQRLGGMRAADIATAEEPEDYSADDGKNKAAQSLGQRGGKARAAASVEAAQANCHDRRERASEAAQDTLHGLPSCLPGKEF